MARNKIPMTSAIRALRDAGVDFTPHTYKYVERGGTAASSAALGIDEHRVIKTLVMHDEQRRPLVVLMHGDREVSTKALARALGVKSVEPCPPKAAQKHSGYQVGGTSPFGLRKPLPVYCEATVLALDRLVINGGKRGLLVEITPAVLTALVAPTAVNVSA